MRHLLVLLIASLLLSHATAEMQTQDVQYNDGDVLLEGFVAWDPERLSQDTPGVLVVHQWMGLTDYEKGRCKQLAELGYVAFALDIYGKGVRPANPQEAGKLAGIYKTDRDLYRRRLNAWTGTASQTRLRIEAADRCNRLLLRRHRSSGIGAKRC